MLILGIETSCDETSASVMRGEDVLSNVISSQEVHAQFGGVVPELAARAHLQMIIPVVRRALTDAGVSLTDIEAIAVTAEPGLHGALLVGENFAKALAMTHNVPLMPINHLEAHIYSGFLERRDIAFPFLALVVSGGHTMIVLVHSIHQLQLLGTTQDDAAGEAFDKVAKLLGLGYPGGPAVDRLAAKGNPKTVVFPKPLMHEDNFDFSFSGMKTSALNIIRKPSNTFSKEDICASFQSAVVQILATKTIRAAQRYNVRDIVVAGGVSANSHLRADMLRRCDALHIRLTVPRLAYCTDNAAMITNLAAMKFAAGIVPPATVASATSTLLPFRV